MEIPDYRKKTPQLEQASQAALKATQATVKTRKAATKFRAQRGPIDSPIEEEKKWRSLFRKLFKSSRRSS